MPKANATAYRETHPEYREKEREREKLRRREQRKNPEIAEKHRTESRLRMRAKRETVEGRARIVSKAKEWRHKMRDEMFAAYGGAVCACCGETHKVFLQIDHIDGGGREHRRQLGKHASSASTVLDLRKRGWPPGFQILCANCNMAKHLLGKCPHKGEASAKG